MLRELNLECGPCGEHRFHWFLVSGEGLSGGNVAFPVNQTLKSLMRNN